MTEQYNPNSFHARTVDRENKRNWICNEISSSTASWCAVTLTLKQDCFVDEYYEKLTPMKCEDIIGDYLHRLNSHFYRNAYRRKNKRLSNIPAIERGKKGNLHIHLLLEIPDYMEADPYVFSDQLKQIWHKSVWAMERIDVQFCKNRAGGAPGWATYITKDLLKDENALCIAHMKLPETSNSVH